MDRRGQLRRGGPDGPGQLLEARLVLHGEFDRDQRGNGGAAAGGDRRGGRAEAARRQARSENQMAEDRHEQQAVEASDRRPARPVQESQSGLRAKVRF